VAEKDEIVKEKRKKKAGGEIGIGGGEGSFI